MAKGLKARNVKGNTGGESSIDWKAINDQVEEGTQGGRISVMIDLGMHTEGKAFSNKGQTGFLTEEDAEQWISEMKKAYGEKHEVFKNGDLDVDDADDVDIKDRTKTIQLEDDGTWVVVKDDPEYIVEANEFGGDKEYQELAILADLTENYVSYGEEIGEKQFRVLLNKSFKGEIKGFQLKPSPPATKDGVWTVKGNTKLNELATATGHKELLAVPLEDADWSEMLGEGLNITIEKSGDEGQWLNVGKCVALKKKKDKETGVVSVEEIDELDIEPVLITFDDVTVEDLENAHIRYDIIKKIKKANDYEGSQMQKAIEEFEKRQKAKFNAKSKSNSEDDAEDDEPKQKRKVNKVEKPKTDTKAKGKTTKKAEEEDEVVDQDTNEEEWDG